MTAHPRRVLHIGQRKTGTTWIQHATSLAAKEGLLIAGNKRLTEWSREVKRSAATDEDYETMASELPVDDALPCFASCEHLIVYDAERMAAAVKRHWPEAHILITTRGPQEYLMSSFRNASTSGFEDGAEYAERMATRHLPRTHDLDTVVAAYRAAFGTEQVHLLPFELLRDDRDGYITRLETIVGAPIRAHLTDTKANASPPSSFLLMARRINALVGEESKRILKSDDWITFMRFAAMAAAEAKGMEAAYSNYLRSSSRATEALPTLDWKAMRRLAKKMTVLLTLEDYQPYLRRYGFRDPEQDAAEMAAEAAKQEDAKAAQG